MEKLIKIIGGTVLAIALFAGIAMFFAIPTYFLWNWLMPQIFGLKTITLVQAWGVNCLCATFFKSTQSNKE